MTPELDMALVRDFPNLYRDRYASMQMTCMCWGFPGDGWEPLIRELSEILEPMGVVAVQVKEKYGTLRFYVDYPERMPKHKSILVEDAIIAAEQRSAITCEACGEPGTLDDNHGWLATLCENHKASRYKEAPMKDNGMHDDSDLDMMALDRAERHERHTPPAEPVNLAPTTAEVAKWVAAREGGQ